jgi:hypothetical protein
LKVARAHSTEPNTTIQPPIGACRFVENKGWSGGLFAAAYALRDGEDTSESDRQRLTELLSWFNERLPTPERFNRSSSKGYYRRTTKGISWFRDTAEQHIARMYELMRIAESNGHSVSVIQEDRLGYVVYEDEFQVVAEPFADTQTTVTDRGRKST